MTPCLPPLGHVTSPPTPALPACPVGPWALPTLLCTVGAAFRPALFFPQRLVTRGPASSSLFCFFDKTTKVSPRPLGLEVLFPASAFEEEREAGSRGGPWVRRRGVRQGEQGCVNTSFSGWQPLGL